MDSWVILGCGYIGTRLTRALLADGKNVMACVHRHESVAELERAGAEVHVFEATRSRAFQHAMTRFGAPVVVYALPPMPGFPGGELIGRATSSAVKVGAQRFIFLSSIAVYGEGRDNEPVDETSPSALSDDEALPFISAETTLDNARGNGLDCAVLRLAPVYGPGRGLREKLRAGTYKLVDDGVYTYSRVHVDDVVGVIRAVAERAPGNSLYCVADDRPAPQREYVEWLAKHVGARMPMSVPSLASGMPRVRIRNRPVSNTKLKQELQYTFRYPTYREGELGIDREQSGASAPGAPVTGAWPLVIHRKDVKDTSAAKSELGRLSARREELAGGAETRIASNGDSMLCLLAGTLEITHDGSKHQLQAGELVEILGAGLQIKNTGGEPAQLLILVAA